MSLPRRCLLPVTLVLATLLLPAAASAAGPVVPGFERLVADGKHVPAVDGRLLAAELNCRSCHAGRIAPAPKPAPLLDEVARRVKPAWLQAFIADPQAVKPGTTMPAVLQGDLDPVIEPLVHHFQAEKLQQVAAGGTV